MPVNHKEYETPESIEQAFYDALERGDLEALMALWSDDEEIVYIPPGGPRLVGHAAVRSAWRETFANGPVHVRPTQAQTIQSSMVSTHSVIEQVMVNNGGKTHLVNLLASNVYFKGAGGWRMILHHASAAPESVQQQREPEPVTEGYLH